MMSGAVASLPSRAPLGGSNTEGISIAESIALFGRSRKSREFWKFPDGEVRSVLGEEQRG